MKDIKKGAEIMMDRTDANSRAWLDLCSTIGTYETGKYIDAKNWKVPIELALGEILDIFAMWEFTFGRRSCTSSHNELFPDIKERVGHFLGVS